MKSSASSKELHYIGLFCNEGIKILRERAMAGDLYDTSIRSLCWKVFLGVLSTDPATWREESAKNRQEYEKIRDAHIVDPHAFEGVELEKNNPLSQDENSPWAKYFQNAEMQKEITHDVLRTYPDEPFFEDEQIQNLLIKLLFLYAKEHSSTKYIQGMNEILAPLVYVVYFDKMKVTTDEPQDIARDERYLEHDAYTLFEAVLKVIGPWFSPLNRGDRNKSKEDLLDEELYVKSGAADETANLQIVQQCFHIHYDLLNEVDPQLSSYLRDLNIEPHLYSLSDPRLLVATALQLQLKYEQIQQLQTQIGNRNGATSPTPSTSLSHSLSSPSPSPNHFHATSSLRRTTPPPINRAISPAPMISPRRRSISPEISMPSHLTSGGSPPRPSNLATRLQDQSLQTTTTQQRPQPQPQHRQNKDRRSHKSILETVASGVKHMFTEDDHEELQKVRHGQVHTANRLDRVIYILQYLQLFNDTPNSQQLTTLNTTTNQADNITTQPENNTTTKQTDNNTTNQKENNNATEMLQSAIDELIQIKEVLLNSGGYNNTTNTNTINNIYNTTTTPTSPTPTNQTNSNPTTPTPTNQQPNTTPQNNNVNKGFSLFRKTR